MECRTRTARNGLSTEGRCCSMAQAIAKPKLNMTEGPLLGKMLLFGLPVMASGVLQLLFNAADVAVVGRFAGDAAMAAVATIL